MQRGARRGDPFRVGMGGEEFGLFGVGAEAGDDDQGDAVAGRGRRHLVVGRRDIRPHPLPVPVDERAAVAAAARDRRTFAAGARHRRRRFGFGARFDLLRRAGAEVELADHDRLRPHRREGGAVGKGEAEAARVDFVARAPAASAGFARPVQVGRLRDVGSGWATPFGRRGGESSSGRSSRIERTAEIAARSAARWARPLPVTAPAIATRRQRRRDQDEAAAEREHERLAGLGADLARLPNPGIGGPAPDSEPSQYRLRSPGNQSPRRRSRSDVLDSIHEQRSRARRRRATTPLRLALAAILAVSAWPCRWPSPGAARPSPARPPRPEPPQNRPHQHQGPDPLQPERRDERQIHLHRAACLKSLAAAARRRRHHAEGPGQAGHDQEPRRQDPGHLQGHAGLHLRRRQQEGRSERRRA